MHETLVFEAELNLEEVSSVIFGLELGLGCLAVLVEKVMQEKVLFK
jgi:hypothetical protein